MELLFKIFKNIVYNKIHPKHSENNVLVKNDIIRIILVVYMTKIYTFQTWIIFLFYYEQKEFSVEPFTVLLWMFIKIQFEYFFKELISSMNYNLGNITYFL